MARLWESFIGRGNAERLPRVTETGAPRLEAAGPAGARRYLAVVAKDRPDLLTHVHRLFLLDQEKVETILDRRQGERRHGAEAPRSERRRTERRYPLGPEADLSANNVVIAEAAATAIPQRLTRWVAAGRDIIETVDRMLDDLASLRRECQALRGLAGRLQAENESLRGQAAEMERALDRAIHDSARVISEIVARLRTA